MTIYEIVFESDIGRDGYEREYFTNKREMESRIVEMKRDHADATKAALESAEKDDFYHQKTRPTHKVDHIVTNTLKITGTTRQKVLWALRYNA